MTCLNKVGLTGNFAPTGMFSAAASPGMASKATVAQEPGGIVQCRPMDGKRSVGTLDMKKGLSIIDAGGLCANCLPRNMQPG